MRLIGIPRAQIQAGAVLTYDGKEVLCKMCAENLPHYIPASSDKVTLQTSRSSSQPPPSPSTRNQDAMLNDRLSPDGASNTLTKSEKLSNYSKSGSDLRQTTLTGKPNLDHHPDSKLDANDFPDGSLTEMDVDHIVRSRLGSEYSYVHIHVPDVLSSLRNLVHISFQLATYLCVQKCIDVCLLLKHCM